MIGRRASQTDVFELAVGVTVSRDVSMKFSAIVLEGIQVDGEGGRCSVRPEQGLVVAQVWEEARKALTAASFTDARQVYRYQIERYVREVDRDTRSIRAEQRERSSGYLRTPLESRPAQDLLDNGFVQRDEGDDLYFAPDAKVLLSDLFLDTHSFRLAPSGVQTMGLVGLATLGVHPSSDTLH